MGSLRNPIGPLPSSIYWRRRAVALAILALLVMLVLWVVNWGGSGGESANEGKGPDGGGPAASITPGPNETDSGISAKPGGRDEAETGGGSGGADSGTSGGGSGSGGSDGSAGGSSGGGIPIGEGSGSGTGAGSGSGGGASVPSGSRLPNCAAGSTELKLRSVKNSYAPDEEPELELIVTNTAGTACKVDLGQKSAVVTIADTADSDDHIWSSDDCPKSTGPAYVEVPAKGSTTRTLKWDRERSAPQCATPSPEPVKPGTYLAEAKIPGLTSDTTSFVLAKD